MTTTLPRLVVLLLIIAIAVAESGLLYPPQPQFKCSSGSLSTTCYVNQSFTFYPPGLTLVGCGNFILSPNTTISCSLSSYNTSSSLSETTFTLLSSLAPPTCSISLSFRGSISIQGSIISPSIFLTSPQVNLSSSSLLSTSALSYGAITVNVSLIGLGLTNLPLWPAPPAPPGAVPTSSAGLPSLPLSTAIPSLVSFLLGGLSCGGAGGGGHYGAGGSGKLISAVAPCADTTHNGGIGNVTTDSLVGFGSSVGTFMSGGGAGGLGVTSATPGLCTNAALLSVAGGAGGGTVVVYGTRIIVNGNIAARGGDASSAGVNGGPGGGAGGSILISAIDSIRGSGSVDVSGGRGGDPGGAGGAGGYVQLNFAGGSRTKSAPSNISIILDGGSPGTSSCGSSGGVGAKTFGEPVNCLGQLSGRTLNWNFYQCGKPDLKASVADIYDVDTLSLLFENENLNETELNQTLAHALQTMSNAKFYFGYDLISEEILLSQPNVKKNNKRALSELEGQTINGALQFISRLADWNVNLGWKKLNALQAGLEGVELSGQFISGGTATIRTIMNENITGDIIVGGGSGGDSALSLGMAHVGVSIDNWSFSANTNSTANLLHFLAVRFVLGSFQTISNWTYDVESNNNLTVAYLNITNIDGWKFIVKIPTALLLNNISYGSGTILSPEHLTSDDDDSDNNNNEYGIGCGVQGQEYKEAIRITILIPVPSNYNNTNTTTSLYIDPNMNILLTGGDESNGDNGGGGGDGTGKSGNNSGDGNGRWIAMGVILGLAALFVVVFIVAVLIFLFVYKKEVTTMRLERLKQLGRSINF
eukprot:TRINITY_DN1037_c0_g1_i1.p1 TRINITY_DN1037_c0_g1~~TRINITY_DN1037_c0_g1_i1.p1  ORF type:complete len:815 (-),score=274.14 TRINITY_DN1037_c0_g1_i1:78-2522(-)